MQRLWTSITPGANAARLVLAVVVLVLFSVTMVTQQETANRLKEDRHNVNIGCKLRNKQLDTLIAERAGLINAERENRTPGIASVSEARIRVWESTIEQFQHQMLTDQDCDHLFPRALRRTS